MNFCKLILSIVVSGITFASTAAPALLLNGDFEFQTLPQNILLPVSSSILGWTVVGTPARTVCQVAAGPLNWPANLTQFLDLTGNAGGAGIRSDPFATVPGQTYQVTFNALNGSLVSPGYAYAGPALSLQASGALLANYNGLADLPPGIPKVLTYSFTAVSSTTTLTFMDTSGFDSNAGWIDNVGIAVVPEPSTIAIISIALLPFAMRLRLVHKRV